MKPGAHASLVASLAIAAAALPLPQALAGTADGTVVGATKLLDNGPDAERFDVVIVAEGYRSSEQSRFAAEAQALHDFVLRTPPFDRLSGALNVWRIDVVSAQSGADDPTACGGSGTRRTYFDASYCTGGVERALLTVGHQLLLGTVDNFVPAWDQVVVLVNSAVEGGLGGSVAISSIAPGWEARTLHAIGHAAFGLADEYDHFDGCGVDVGREMHPAIEPVAPNVTIEAATALLEWTDLVDPATPVPTTRNPDETCTSCDSSPDPYGGVPVVGAYEGGHHFPCGVFRPAFRCAMRDLGPFCPVCAQRIARTLAPFQAEPENEPPVCDAGGPYRAECAGPSTLVTLDGSGSSDPDGDALALRWSGPFDGGTADGSPATVAFAGTGLFSATLSVDDGVDPATCEAEVVVEDTLPPALVAPAAVEVECAGRSGTVVDLGAPTVTDACDSAASVSHDDPVSFPGGETIVTWRATDASGNSATATQTVTVADGRKPGLTIHVSPIVLWPPDGRLVPVSVRVRVKDGCDPQPAVRLVSVKSSEKTDPRVPDIVGAEPGTDDREFLLRATSKSKHGRVYTIRYEAIDDAGNRRLRTAHVWVPSKQGCRR